MSVQKKIKKSTKRSKRPALHKDLKKIIKAEDTEFAGRLFSSSYQLNDSWKEKKRNWGHSLHSMASRGGSFPPALAAYFIENFSKPGDVVLDPFSGKGTTPLQACLSNRKGIGVDITPEAYILTAAKTMEINHDAAVKYLRQLKFNKSKKQNAKLLKEVPDNVKVFYHDDVLEQLISLREALKEDYSLDHIDYLGETPSFELEQHLEESFQAKRERKEKMQRAKFAQYWLGVLVGILHGSSELSLSVPCSHSFSMSPGYVKNYSAKHGLEKPQRDVLECMIKRSAKLQSDGANSYSGRAILGSAMQLPEYLKGSVDLIVTSPPYFTAQTYAWDNWLREWFLGFDFKEVRTKTLHTGVVDKYAAGINEHLREAYAALKPKSWAFVVVGDVIKKKVTKIDPKNYSGDSKTAKADLAKGKMIIEEQIITAEIIAQEAEKVGFGVELIINDDIPQNSRYFSSYLKENQGLKLDRVVCLYKN